MLPLPAYEPSEIMMSQNPDRVPSYGLLRRNKSEAQFLFGDMCDSDKIIVDGERYDILSLDSLS
jgi:hypothetical protein